MRRDLTDIARNRRALLEMILIPLLMTPTLTLYLPFGITLVSQKFFQEQILRPLPRGEVEVRESDKPIAQRMALVGRQGAPGLVETIRKERKLQLVEVDDPMAALDAQRVQIVLKVDEALERRVLAGEPSELRVILKPVNIKSIIAYVKLKTMLDDYFVSLREKVEEPRGRYVKPKVHVGTPAEKREIAGFVLGLVAPSFFLFWMMMGGNSVAIDLTAGEKERKTLEGLFFLPIRRRDILLGKFWVVVIVSFLTVVLAVIGLAIPLAVFYPFLPGSWQEYLPAVRPSLLQLVLITLSTLLLSILLAGVQICLGLTAKSVKEAEYFLYPLVLPIVVPGIIVIFFELPDLSAAAFFIPVLANLLLMREAFAGAAAMLHLLPTVAVTALCVGLLLKLAHAVLQKDRVLFTVN